MAINISVQYDGGLLPDIIRLTQCYNHWGTRLDGMKMFCRLVRPTNLMSRMNGKKTHTHTHRIPPWEDKREWHRMTRMTRPDCAVMCNLINTHTHTHTMLVCCGLLHCTENGS